MSTVMKPFFLCFLLSTLDVRADITTDLEVFLKLEGTYLDSTGSNSVSFANTNFGPDRFGNANKAATFNGNNQKITIDSLSFSKLYNSDRTVSYWFSTTKSDGIAVNIGSDHQYTPYNEQFAIAARSDGVQLYGGGGANDFDFSNTGTYFDGLWRHFTVVKNSVNALLYINGVHVGTTAAHVYNTGASNNQNMEVGVWNDNNRWFQGSINRVRVYTRALSAADVLELYYQDARNPLPQAVIDMGLHAFFRFAGNYVDETGNNVPSYVNAGFGPDRFGNEGMALTLNGVDQKITIDSLSFPKLYNTDRTISYWFATTKSDGIAVNIGSDHANTPANEQFAITARTDGVRVYGGITGNDFYFSNAGNYVDGNWRHFTVVKSGSNVKLYVNGEYVGETASHNYNTGATNNQNMEIGQWNDNNRWFQGSISHLRVYTRALTVSEIAVLYDQDSQNPIYYC